MTENPKLRRRIMIAVMAAVSAAAIIIPMINMLFMAQMVPDDVPVATKTTTAKPSGLIRPVSVRPVISAFVTTPDQCPPPAIAAPADQPMKVCDVTRTAVYDLAPEGVKLALTNVESFKNPLTGANIVQLSMTKDASKTFTQYTKDHLDQQAAFIRGGIVVWAPKITEPIEGEVLQLTGDLTLEQTDEIAGMIRDGN
jgi:hypothetical protein